MTAPLTAQDVATAVREHFGAEHDTLAPEWAALAELARAPGARHLTDRVEHTPRMAKLRANRDRVRRIAHRHGASNVRVFGSVARGEDGPDSDVDLLVDLDVRARGLLPLGAIADELSALLGERVDVAPATALAPHVADSAIAEAVPL